MYICNDCPRKCGADRDKTVGFCGCGIDAKIAKVVDPFEYEEPCIGSCAAVFFGGCNLRCSYCQNHAISRGAVGTVYPTAALAALFDRYETLDLVTPTHFLTAIERAVPLLEKPHRMIYNTSGYETVEGVKRAAAFTDVFLTDIKYCENSRAAEYSAAPDYFKYASAAAKEMRKTADEWSEADGRKILRRGLVVRHLVLPGHADNSLRVLDFIAAELGTDTVISLMSQFTPNGIGAPHARLKKLEYKRVCEHALKLGFTNGYFQAFDSASAAFVPDF